MFDPYHKWLGISKEVQPPTHYRLLGIHPSEQDREVIDNGPFVGFPQLGFAAAITDNSNTQFALLALWAAKRHGIPTERALRQAARSFAKTQNLDGGWGYTPNSNSTPSMTCAGLLGLAMGHGARTAKDSEGPEPADRGIEAGLRALESAFEPHIRTDMRFVWCVQHVAVLFSRKTIDDKDWYDVGSQHLLDM